MESWAANPRSGSQAELTLKILDLLRETKYELVQENGQRRLTAPEFRQERCKGAEVFLGRLPRDCYECELMPILSRVGRLLELRLMLDFSGSTRGYAFALFESPAVARRACQQLDRYEIRPGHRIGVVKSIDNCRLFFGGVPKDKTKDEFMKELRSILEGITDIYMYPSAQDRTQNRGFIFVEFQDHRAAAMARRKLIPGRIVMWDHEIAVDWADPEPGEPVDDELMRSVTALFVRNINVDESHQRLREIFQTATGVQILKLKKMNHFAFVHYETREMAERVLQIMTAPGGVAQQENWEIRWAKPICTSKLQERQRSIDEALSTSKTERSKQTGNRRKQKQIPEAQMTSASSHQRLLQIFVAENFQANCRFECYGNREAGYTCKIIATFDTRVIFEFLGLVSSTMEEAVEEASSQLLDRLRQAKESHESWTSRGIPESSEEADRQLRTKVEACR